VTRVRHILIVLTTLGIAAVVVAIALHRPEPPVFAPTPARESEVDARLTAPAVYTVDATSATEWQFFDFSRGSVVSDPGPLDWDLAFRRFRIIANGGQGFAGRGGIADLGPVVFDGMHSLPATGYAPTSARRDSTNAAIAHWYRYGFTSHILKPEPRVYAVRTADGRYAKLEILGYYCPGARPGCLTFRYVYQGSGSRDLHPPGDVSTLDPPPAAGDSSGRPHPGAAR
jgi:hypothetical protein